MNCPPFPRPHPRNLGIIPNSSLIIFFHKISYQQSESPFLSSFPPFLTVPLVCFFLEIVPRLFSLLSFSSTFKGSAVCARNQCFLKCKSNYITLLWKQFFRLSPTPLPLPLRWSTNSQVRQKWPMPHLRKSPQLHAPRTLPAVPSPEVSASGEPFSFSLPCWPHMLSKHFKILPPEGFLWPDSPPAELQAHLLSPILHKGTDLHSVWGYSEILKFSKVNVKIHLSSEYPEFNTDSDLTAGEINKIFLCVGLHASWTLMLVPITWRSLKNEDSNLAGLARIWDSAL